MENERKLRAVNNGWIAEVYKGESSFQTESLFTLHSLQNYQNSKMESLCFLFECLSLSEKRKRTFEYEDEGIGHRSPKRFSLSKTSESNVGLQNIGEKIRLERSDGLPEMRAEMGAGVSPLLKGNGMEVDKDVEEIGRNLPRDKTNNRQRRTTRPEPNHLSVRNTNRFKPNVTAENVKDLRSLLDSKRKETAKRPRKVESHPSDSLTGSKLKVTFYIPNVTAEVDGTSTPKMPKKPKVTVEGVQDLRSFLDSRRRGKSPRSHKRPEYL